MDGDPDIEAERERIRAKCAAENPYIDRVTRRRMHRVTIATATKNQRAARRARQG